MDKGTSFFLAEDPQRPELGQYILHIHRPISLVRVLAMEEEDPITDEGYVSKDYNYNGRGETEVFQLVCIPFTDGIVEFNKDDEKLLLSVLDRAWDWYKDYIQWEDRQIDEI